MESGKVIMTLWVSWETLVKLVIELDPADAENAQDMGGKRIPQGMNEFEKEEVAKSSPVVKNKLNEWLDWLVDYVPEPIKNDASEGFLRAKNSIQRLYDGVKKTLKGDVEEQTQTEDNVDLKPHKK